MSLAETAVIGKLPGYNINIDQDKEFEKNLLKGVTFIDLFPTSYQFGTKVGDTFSNATAKTLEKTFKDYLNMLQKDSGIFKRETARSIKMFQGVLRRMQGSYNYLGDNFPLAKKIRIVAANDSTFTESFSSNYDNSNGIVQAYDAIKNSKLAKWGHMYQKGLASSSHIKMLESIGNAGNNINSGGHGSNGGLLSQVLEGAAFGVNIAAPQMWSSSNYSSNLTVFVKLIAPVGTEECIQQNILKPLMYLMAASSPITSSGILSGVPLLWEVQAQGVTNFRLGAITNMTIIRGSFETTFNYLLQPTVIDVRLTISPLLSDFAVQSDNKAFDSIYDKREYLGVQNPSDLVAGTMNAATGSFGPEKIVSIRI